MKAFSMFRNGNQRPEAAARMTHVDKAFFGEDEDEEDDEECSRVTRIEGSALLSSEPERAETDFFNGDKYVGDVHSGKRHGHGVYYYDSGDKCVTRASQIGPPIHTSKPLSPSSSSFERMARRLQLVCVFAGTPASGERASSAATESTSTPMATDTSGNGRRVCLNMDLLGRMFGLVYEHCPEERAGRRGAVEKVRGWFRTWA
eukprot:2702203-Pleurochrysis_carterae.AAC.1